jgi:putative membrane protein
LSLKNEKENPQQSSSPAAKLRIYSFTLAQHKNRDKFDSFNSTYLQYLSYTTIMKLIQKYFPYILLSVYISWAIAFSLAPYSRDVWYAEMIPIFGIVLFLVVLFVRGVRFSNLAYFLMSILLFLHTYGAYYTFELAPFAWFNDLFGFERNMFDRVAHFSVGFYAYALFEYVIRYNKVSSKFWAFLLSVCCIGTVAMAYELIEWRYAVTEGGEAGLAFLGSQGDIWDAQKDMLMDTLGAITAATFALFLVNKK